MDDASQTVIDPTILASMRLECIKIASGEHPATANDVVTYAEALYAFVLNGPVTVSGEPQG